MDVVPNTPPDPVKLQNTPAAVSSSQEVRLRIAAEFPAKYHAFTARATTIKTHNDTFLYPTEPAPLLRSPVVEAPDEGQNRQVIQKRKIARDDDRELEPGLKSSA